MNKPPYAIPSVAEIGAVPENGLRVLSTFTGAGGSCLGFRWAGFRTVAACEFVEAARETYCANFPTVPVEARDIRTVTGAELLELAGVEEVDVLEGSPPCASFSTSGKRSAKWGVVSAYSDTAQRSDDLFDEYLRLVGEIRPRAFVAENVSGLVKGVAKGYFREILAGARTLGYRVGARVLDAQWLGVPQRRQRVIIVGIRDDLDREPVFPDPFPYRYSIRDVLPCLAGGIVDGMGSNFTDRRIELDGVAPTIPAQLQGRTGIRVIEGDGPSIDGYAIANEYDRLRPGESSDRYPNLVCPDLNEPCPTVTQLGGANPGVASVIHPTERRKFTIAELRRLCGFPDDFVLTGTYAQQWERLGRAVPPPMMRAVAARLVEVLL